MIYNAEQGGAVKSPKKEPKEAVSVEPDQGGKVSNKNNRPQVRVFGGVSRERLAEVGGKVVVVKR